jgi:hypothetical protein
MTRKQRVLIVLATAGLIFDVVEVVRSFRAKQYSIGILAAVLGIALGTTLVWKLKQIRRTTG